MTGATTTPAATPNEGCAGAPAHRKGHRRQESMYAMTGLYSETVPEEDGTTAEHATTTLCHDTVIKCHSRNPSSSFDR